MRKFEFNIQDVLFDWKVMQYPHPQVVDFEGCCGADIYFDFPNITEEFFISSMKAAWNKQYEAKRDCGKCASAKMPGKEFFKKILREEIKKILLDIPDKGNLLFVILIECQKKLFGKGLIEKGFRLVSDRNVNKSTGNRLYVYLRDPATPKGAKKTKRTFR